MAQTGGGDNEEKRGRANGMSAFRAFVFVFVFLSVFVIGERNTGLANWRRDNEEKGGGAQMA